jgi:hypothetical protein
VPCGTPMRDSKDFSLLSEAKSKSTRLSMRRISPSPIINAKILNMKKNIIISVLALAVVILGVLEWKANHVRLVSEVSNHTDTIVSVLHDNDSAVRYDAQKLEARTSTTHELVEELNALGKGGRVSTSAIRWSYYDGGVANADESNYMISYFFGYSSYFGDSKASPDFNSELAKRGFVVDKNNLFDATTSGSIGFTKGDIVCAVIASDISKELVCANKNSPIK